MATIVSRSNDDAQPLSLLKHFQERDAFRTSEERLSLITGFGVAQPFIRRQALLTHIARTKATWRLSSFALLPGRQRRFDPGPVPSAIIL